MHKLVEDIMRGSSEGTIPLNYSSRAKLISLKGNTPVPLFSRYLERGKKNIKMHECIDDCLLPDIDENDGVKKLALLKEAIEDWSSFLPEDV